MGTYTDTAPPVGSDTYAVSAVNATGASALSAPVSVPVGSISGAPQLRVLGNQLVDQHGTAWQLRGVNRSGAEYVCAEGGPIFDGPTDDDTSIAAMLTWKINCVRLPLNESCWLGINGINSAYSGAAYQAAIVDYVNRLNAHGIVVILNLHFSAPGTTVPDAQVPMADRDHSNAFWTSLATVFRDNHSVLFDLFNEPYPDGNNDTTAAWTCCRDGGTCPGVSFVAAGMQEMLNAVRATGATQPCLIAGPQYAGVVDRWAEFAPHDPLNQLIASIHIYLPNWSPCDTQTCWDGTMAPLALSTPIIVGEIGSVNCTASSITPFLQWADAHGVHYTAWAWNVGDCAKEPSLITSYAGVPTQTYGQGFHDHLLALG